MTSSFLPNQDIDSLVKPISNLSFDAKIEKFLDRFVVGSGGEIQMNSSPSISRRDMEIPLQDRAATIKSIKYVFDERTRAYIDKSRGRSRYRLPVLVGIPGMGKSRLLNEYLRYFDEQDASHLFACFVVYNNGHSVTDADKQCNVETSFSVRLLHSVFQEPGSFKIFMNHLLEDPDFYKTLDIVTACRTVRAALERNNFISDAGVLRLFVGVDEFQSIPGGSLFYAESYDEVHNLSLLVSSILDASLALTEYKIYLYPIFAGVEWSKLSTFGSSNPLLFKITPPFLTLSATLKIGKYLFPKGIRSDAFFNCLLDVGDHPRLAVQFLENLNLCGDRKSKEIYNVRNCVLVSNHIGRINGGGLTCSALARLIAYSILQESVEPNAPSGVLELSWQQLANRGILQLSNDNKVDLSYTFIIGSCRKNILDVPTPSPALEFFWKCLQDVLKLSDSLLEPWQKWERFGAYYRMHATYKGVHSL
eukprot:scaffold8807_cov149-Ochromonas_danica.AAC.1